jgi:2-oxoisovalerate dehydrogenase E1 component beta subunit
MRACIRDNDPCLFLEHKYLYRRIKEVVPQEDYIIPIGKAKVVEEGDDLTIVTYGMMVHRCLEVVKDLDASIEVIDLRSIYPLDREAIVQSVQKTSKLLVVHEDTRTGGIAGEISATINEEAFEYLSAPVIRVTAPDTPVPYSAPMEDFFLVQPEEIAKAAKKLLAY